MPALGSPVVRQLRRMASAYADSEGTPSIDPTEVLGRYETGQAEGTITRRELLRRGALVGAGALAATSLGIARAPRAAAAKDASVIVIGAGLGGLACTYRLHRHGIAATLYEAQERLGGRCFSIRDFFDADQTAEHGDRGPDRRSEGGRAGGIGRRLEAHPGCDRRGLAGAMTRRTAAGCSRKTITPTIPSAVFATVSEVPRPIT